MAKPLNPKPVRHAISPAQHTTSAGARRLPDYRLDELVLDPETRGVQSLAVGAILTDGQLEMTIVGASVLTLTALDKDKALLTGNRLTEWAWGKNSTHRDDATWIKRGRKIDIDLDDLTFRLKRTEKQAGRVLVMEMEELAVAKLRGKRGAKQAVREQDGRPGVTRAQFVKALAVEAGVETYIPELDDPQATQHDPALGKQATKVERNAQARKGIGKATHLFAAHRLTPGELANANILLEVADQVKAPEKAVLAMLCAGIVEAPYFANPGLDPQGSTSAGIFQWMTRYSGSLARSRDVRLAAKTFLTKGFWGKGSAIHLARSQPHLTPGNIAQLVEGSHFPDRYDMHLTEAKQLLAAYGGATTSSGGTSVVVEKAFKFSRGAKENSWDCIQRLAEEVQWRAFVRKGVLWFISDEALFAQDPTLEADEDNDEIESIVHTVDQGARDVTADLTVAAHAGRWTALPGMTIRVTGEGPADGKWLVVTVTRALWDDLAQIVCAKPTGKKDEPAAETATVTFGGKTQDESGTGKGKWTYGPGVPHTLNKRMRSFMDRMATFTDRTIIVTTTTNHNYLTTSGNVSDHNGGGAADIGSVANHFTIGDARGGGYEIAIAAHRACGTSLATARKRAGTPNYTRWKCPEGSVQILWMVPEHHDHVHVGTG